MAFRGEWQFTALKGSTGFICSLEVLEEGGMSFECSPNVKQGFLRFLGDGAGDMARPRLTQKQLRWQRRLTWRDKRHASLAANPKPAPLWNGSERKTRLLTKVL